MVKELLLAVQRRKKILLFLFFLFFSSLLFAQQKITVKGTVLGENNTPLAGVSVKEKGEPGGTTTDAEGRFTIQVTGGATLIFSNVGYKEAEVQTSNGEDPLSVRLVSTSSTLGEVVVVSYGTQKRRDITGSIAQINANEVKDMPVPDIGQKLQGKFAGVQINQTDGTPGGDVSIRIRGAASINAGNSPLVVIDGFPTESGLQTLSPDQIESITV